MLVKLHEDLDIEKINDFAEFEGARTSSVTMIKCHECPIYCSCAHLSSKAGHMFIIPLCAPVIKFCCNSNWHLAAYYFDGIWHGHTIIKCINTLPE